jgi:hypothetical protein
VYRGRVWTARELIGVMAITGRSEALPSITLAKIRFDGRLAELAEGFVTEDVEHSKRAFAGPRRKLVAGNTHWHAHSPGRHSDTF